MIALAQRTIAIVALTALAGAATACMRRDADHPPVAAAPQTQDGVVLLVQTPQHLDVALLTARDLVATHEASDVRVLACGPAVSALQADGAAAKKLGERDRAHVRIVACGLSLERAGISKDALAPDVEVVPNGLVEVLRLQRAGFRSVEL